MRNMSCGNFLRNKRIIILLCLLYCSHLLFAVSYKEIGDNVWNEFRAKFPTPYRTIACHEFDDGSRVYIISEPPNNISINTIDEIFDGFVHYIWTNTTKLGYDGMMRDIVIYTDGIPFLYHEQIINDLNLLIYETDYKASYLSLPYKGVTKQVFYDENYNVTVNDRSLYEWIYGEDKLFKNILSGMVVSPQKIIDGRFYGVYLSISDNIVVWCVPVNGNISKCGNYFHIFEMESDFLLGAISSNEVVMIVGRKRATDFVSVPPLRKDEALMLAAAGNVISQSLNITTPVYCKIRGIYDWCPAWVTDNIYQSEYAYLLTLTDLYLKFWLCNYNYEIIGYNNCRPHTRFDDSVLERLSYIRFNWNTRGYVKRTVYNECSIVHFKNIGCLNCNLFDKANNSLLSGIDESVYNYFRSCRSAEIFRVAQYTMLYEIFNIFGITAYKYQYNTKEIGKSAFLSSSQRIFTRIKELDDVEIDLIAKDIYQKEFIQQLSNNYTEQEKVNYVKDEDEVKTTRVKWEKALNNIAIEQANKLNLSLDKYLQSDEYKELSKKVEEKIIKESLKYYDLSIKNNELSMCLYNIIPSLKKTRDNLKNLSSSQFQNLCEYCASPNTYHNENIEQIKDFVDSLECQYYLSKFTKYMGINIDEMFQDYVNYYEKAGSFWFKAPTVVVINNNSNYIEYNNWLYIKNYTVIGGHSIHSNFIEQKPANTPHGQHILSFTGDPLKDAKSYGLKAVHSPSLDDKIKYIRHSREAMSQKIISPKERDNYNGLFESMEKNIYSQIREAYKYEEDKKKIINDFITVKNIAESELSNNKNLNDKQKAAYEFVRNVAKRREKNLRGRNNEETILDKERMTQQGLFVENKGSDVEDTKNNVDVALLKGRIGKDTILKGKNAEKTMLKGNEGGEGEENEESEDDEIKELRKLLRKLQMTLAELKKNQ